MTWKSEVVQFFEKHGYHQGAPPRKPKTIDPGELIDRLRHASPLQYPNGSGDVHKDAAELIYLLVTHLRDYRNRVKTLAETM